MYVTHSYTFTLLDDIMASFNEEEAIMIIKRIIYENAVKQDQIFVLLQTFYK